MAAASLCPVQNSIAEKTLGALAMPGFFCINRANKLKRH